MANAPTPEEIFDRAVEEGDRRLSQSMLELVATSFIAGFTVVFGIVALGIVHALVEPVFGHTAQVAGALAFGLGVVFLVVGRAELFNENFFDPVAKAIDQSDSLLLWPLFRLWVVTLVLNFVGGVVLLVVFSVEGVLPPGTLEALRTVAEEIVHREMRTIFASAIAGGALVALLSFLLQAVNGDGGRITMSYIVGFLLALGPFDHVVVTVLHVGFGIVFGASVGLTELVELLGVAIAGNLVGGIGLVTLTHVAQAKGGEKSSG